MTRSVFLICFPLQQKHVPRDLESFLINPGWNPAFASNPPSPLFHRLRWSTLQLLDKVGFCFSWSLRGWPSHGKGLMWPLIASRKYVFKRSICLACHVSLLWVRLAWSFFGRCNGDGDRGKLKTECGGDLQKTEGFDPKQPLKFYPSSGRETRIVLVWLN